MCALYNRPSLLKPIQSLGSVEFLSLSLSCSLVLSFPCLPVYLRLGLYCFTGGRGYAEMGSLTTETLLPDPTPAIDSNSSATPTTTATEAAASVAPPPSAAGGTSGPADLLGGQ